MPDLALYYLLGSLTVATFGTLILSGLAFTPADFDHMTVHNGRIEDAATKDTSETNLVEALIADGHITPEEGDGAVAILCRFRIQHAGLCDRCDGFIAKGEQIVRTSDHQLLCRRCAK